MCFQYVYISRHFTLYILLHWRFQSALWITISWDVSFWKPQSVFLFLRWENELHLERCSGRMWKRNLTCVERQIWRVRCEGTGEECLLLVSGGKVYENNIITRLLTMVAFKNDKSILSSLCKLTSQRVDKQGSTEH